MRHPFHALVVAIGASTPLFAQAQVPFPMDRDGLDAASGGLVLRSNSLAISELVGRDRVLMMDVEMPSGASVDLDLERVRHESLSFGFRVDGQPAPQLLDDLDLSIWKGTVLGDPTTEVALSFSRAGSRGWVRSADELAHLMPQPEDGNDWERSYAIFIDDARLVELGMDLSFDCGAETLEGYGKVDRDAIPHHDIDEPQTMEGSQGVLYGCTVAIETDYQLYQVFGNSLSAETAYVTTLLALSSDRYVEQHRTQLDYPYVQFYTSSNDPWDTSGSSIDLLNDFVAAWSGNTPAGAVLGHFVSGSGLGGGVAYLGVLCDGLDQQEFSFAVSGNIDGDTPFPIQQGPFNWDFVVFTHEGGHNFSTPHTHDFCPTPLDECAPNGYFGSCQSSQVCTSSGTTMSYCHLCSGGLSNVTTFFHPETVDVVANHVDACLPLIVGISALPPNFVAPGVPTEITADVEGSPISGVDMFYRFSSGAAFQSVPMVDQGSGTWAADLPSPECDDSPEFYFQFDDATAGTITSDTFTATVGIQEIVLSDDFEADLGWTVGAFDDDATTGIWVRDDPIGTSAQPSAGIGTGSDTNCFFTGQGSSGGSLGEEDIDGGKTTLFSPVLDLSSGDADISYYRWYSNDTGSTPNTDVFEVEITGNGSTWVDVETVGPVDESSGGWIFHEFTVSDFVSPTANVQVRFIASDEGDGSLVEAAVDQFDVFRVSCEVCAEDQGFGGPGSMDLSLCGPPLGPGVTADLQVTGGMANALAFLVYSPTSNPTAFEGGTLVPVPPAAVLFALDGSGELNLGVPGDVSPVDLYLQIVAVHPITQAIEISNAVLADF